MLIYFGQFSFAQPSSNYYKNIDKAKSALDKNEYKKSDLFYSKGFEQNAGKVFLEDKVALQKNKKQIYGSVVLNTRNINYVAQIDDIDGLEKRRADLGLKSIKHTF
jgi:hypothetical protein